jgi:hypothetical protein
MSRHAGTKQIDSRKKHPGARAVASCVSRSASSKRHARKRAPEEASDGSQG